MCGGSGDGSGHFFFGIFQLKRSCMKSVASLN